MTLTLHYHPLSSYCWKVLIPLYEADVAFEPNLVNLGDPESRARFLTLWPVGKFPVIETNDGQVIAESSSIIEWLALNYPSARFLVPDDPDTAWEVRRWDRFLDLHVHSAMQRIIADRLRPADDKDPTGVSDARRAMAVGLDIAEARMAGREFIATDGFTMADCAAAPALYYADKAAPFGDARPNLTAYLERLKARPSFARVLEEAVPFFQYYPSE